MITAGNCSCIQTIVVQSAIATQCEKCGGIKYVTVGENTPTAEGLLREILLDYGVRSGECRTCDQINGKHLDCCVILKIETFLAKGLEESREPLPCHLCGTILDPNWLNCPKCEGESHTSKMDKLPTRTQEKP